MFVKYEPYKEELFTILERIDKKRALLEKARPLPSSAIARVKQDLALEWTYNSNGIEGNSLTLAETRVVLEDGMTVGGKSLREHFETLNHEKAIGFLESLLVKDYVLRPIDILSIHELVLHQIDDDFAGRLRNGMVRILGANFTPPAPSMVSDYLDELVSYVVDNPDGLHPLLMTAVFHHRLVWIHPFFDGNGRTARLAMNLVLLKVGFPPAIILKNDRKKYYQALNLANKGEISKLALMIMQAAERSLNMYLNNIPDAYGDYKCIADLVKEEELPYGMEYISLLARRGEINAHKEGRKWYSTKKDILEYAAARGKV